MLGLNLLCLRRRRSRGRSSRTWSPPRLRSATGGKAGAAATASAPPPPPSVVKAQPPPPPRARPTPQPRGKAPPLQPMARGRAMAPAPPLPVTEDTPPDMLAGAMDLRVVLPGGRAVRMSAERCTQMMDLLVQITTAHKMAPGGYVLQPVGERGILPYKPSTPIGALDTWTIQIVPKPRNLNTNSIKKAPLKPNNQQPFEQTFRLQVHLPRNQLFVARVSPKCLLSDVLLLACTEKNLDPNKYELRHPANLEERLRPEWTLADYKLQEVTLVAKGNRPLGSGLSSSDIMALQKEEEKRRQQVKANGTAGSTVLGLMLGKNSQSSGCDGSISSDSLGGRSISPSRSDETPSPPGSSLPPPRPIRKRRPAPKPPTQAPQSQQHSQAVISHSRNSSDSSGYHEASILSESPESNGQSSSPSGTLPRRSKLTGNPAQPTNVATTNNLSRSLSNLAHISNGEHNSRPLSSSMQKNGHSVSTTSLASSGLGKKKKAAPPPPPLVKSVASGHLLPEQRTASLSTLSSQSSSDSFDREIYSRTGTLERPPSSQSSTTSNFARPDSLPEESSIPEENENQSSQDVSNMLLKNYEHPEPLHLEGETDKTDAQDLLQPVNNHLQNFSETCNLTEPDLPSQIQQNLVSLKPQPLSGTQNPASFEEPSEFVAETADPVINQHNLTSVFPKKGVAPPRTILPDVVSDLEKERDEIQKDFESVTKELQEVILAEEAKQDSSVRNIPSPKTESPSLSLVDWEYHLPAPPSAFRDNQSPIPSREVDNSSLIPEVSVFDEASPEVLPPAEFTDNNKSSIETETNLVSLMMEKESSLIQNLVNGVTKVNPLFSEEKYEEDSLKERKQSSLRNEYLTVNGKTGEKMTECEEDWSPQQIADYPDSTAETVKEKRAPLQSSENNRQFHESHQVNQLSNFTISTYEKPRDIDTLFQESNAIQKEESEFKKPVVTSLYRRANSTTLSSNISRNNSFSSKDNPNYERTSVKRSMSHASNSGRTLRAKSIGNLTLEASRDGGELQKSESRMNERHEGLRKTTSEANINQDYGKSNRLAELQDQFLQWQEQLLRQTQPDIPLQSLQVLRRILSPSQDNSRDKDKDKQLIGEASLSSKIAASSNVRSNEDMDILEMKQTTSHEDQLHRQTSSTSNNHKRYSYHGPPAVNFTTWSERPKSQVSIKVDNDYRIGKGQLGPLVSDKVENGLDVKEANITEDQVDAKQNCNVTRSENMTPANDHMKVEPTALTMRIISHSTPSGYKKTSTSLSQDLAQNPNKETSISHLEGSRVYNYNSAQIADPSRVPIVRAVELKKSALHAQQNTSERRENTSTVKLRKKEENNQNVKDSLDNGDRSNDDAEEKFLGVNNLAKRFSLGVSNSESVKVNYVKPRPASVYSSSDSKPKINSHINKVVVNNMKDFNGISNSNGISTGKKYTSVVGINGMDTHEDSFQQNSRQTPKVNVASTLQRNDSTSLSKPTIPVSARYPMPVVKGFRYATNDYSDSSLVAADSYKMLQNSQQPVTVKILHSNSFSNPAQRNTVIEPLSTVNLRIQPSSLKSSQVPSKEKPDPPSAPPLPKKIPSARPKSLPAPEANPRDQLMDSIRNFGREKLKHVRSTPPSNVLLIM